MQTLAKARAALYQGKSLRPVNTNYSAHDLVWLEHFDAEEGEEQPTLKLTGIPYGTIQSVEIVDWDGSPAADVKTYEGLIYNCHFTPVTLRTLGLEWVKMPKEGEEEVF